MNNPIEKSYTELVILKYQLYNSLFLTLPLDAVEQTGLLLPLLQDACEKGFNKGLSPTAIIDIFLAEHKPYFTEDEKISFLFKSIQYIERQIVLIDALEEAAYSKIHRLEASGSWERMSAKVNRLELQEKMKSVLEQFGIRVVLTAHPTQFYPGSVLAISNDLTKAVENGDISTARDLLQQLGRTPFYRKEKPSVFSEAQSLIWYLVNIFYFAAGDLLDKLDQQFSLENIANNPLISFGFWPGGDRDGNPFVSVDTTRKVAKRLRFSLVTNYYQEIKQLKRRLSFPGIAEVLNDLDELFYLELTHPNAEKNVDIHFLLNKLDEIENVLIEKHQSLFLDKLISFKRKVHLFGFYFASIDIRQDSRVISKAFDSVVEQNSAIFKNYLSLSESEKIQFLLQIDQRIDRSIYKEAITSDTLESFEVIREIQQLNGEKGSHRYIISNCRGSLDMAKVFALAKMCAWGNETLSLDVIPLFETIEDLKNASESMTAIYSNTTYRKHLENRENRQTVMLGFSDGTKDGGYLMANWAIFKAKEEVTKVSRENQVDVLFFDGRGGPPARGGGNSHLFYSAMGKKIESHQIQITVQGQTISSHYGHKEAAIHNLGHLITAGIENNLYDKASSNLNFDQRKLIDELSNNSYLKYQALKNHELFIPFLEERSTLKYYGLANIGSRPSKRGGDGKLKFEDLRAIPFVGAWSQLKQNVPGFYGVGSALKEQEAKGNMQACIDLYKHSTFFKALIGNSMQSMSKTNFAITQYMENDPKFGGFWKLIHEEFLLSKEMVLKVSGYKELLEDNARSRMSIQLREKVVLPLLAIQQYALIQIQKAQDADNDDFVNDYEKMVMRSLFGNINASRNSV
ncbi:MAG: phosphoenolpyruvate carboxylase [Bacteroidales bacterium]|nr:phosphoenolpyruvate carboxylase [Bacteroidales bacterium]